MLAKMVYKNMDKKNVLLYSFSIILSVALEMVFGTAFMVNDKYGLNEKTGSMNWLCTMFFLAAGAMSIFFILYSTAYYVRTNFGRRAVFRPAFVYSWLISISGCGFRA